MDTTSYEKIGQGLYEILLEAGDVERLTPISFGMAPQDFMEKTENMIKDKWAMQCATHLFGDNPSPENVKLMRNSLKPNLVNKAMHHVYLGLLQGATKHGMMRV